MIDDTIGNKTTIGNMPTMRQYTGLALGRIDQYELLKELGGGGFGTGYLARDTVSGVDVAVKGLPPLVKNNREEMENIRSNFALVSRLHHPNIAAALVLHPAKEVTYAAEDVRQKLRVDPGDTLMVMEYAPGVTLSKWRKQFPNGIVPFAKALEITRQIASALDYAHERKVVHRDVKPANVMVETEVDGSVRARVLDFGLAAEVRSSMGRVSREIHDTSGTRPYMAPEQWGGDRQGPATDQYALAATFYELVAGHVPFANAFETGDPMIMMTVVTTRQPEMPNGLPESARNALAKALAKKPSDRFTSCCAFTAALAGDSSAAHVPAAVASAPLSYSPVQKIITAEAVTKSRHSGRAGVPSPAADGGGSSSRSVFATASKDGNLCPICKVNHIDDTYVVVMHGNVEYDFGETKWRVREIPIQVCHECKNGISLIRRDACSRQCGSAGRLAPPNIYTFYMFYTANSSTRAAKMGYPPSAASPRSGCPSRGTFPVRGQLDERALLWYRAR